MNRSTTLAMLAAVSIIPLALALASCSKPSDVCASQSTKDAVTKIILDAARNSEKEPNDDEPGIAPIAMQNAFISKVTLAYDMIRYLGQNKDTKKTECVAGLHVTMPTLHSIAITSSAASGAVQRPGLLDGSVNYTIEPQAGGGAPIVTVADLQVYADKISAEAQFPPEAPIKAAPAANNAITDNTQPLPEPSTLPPRYTKTAPVFVNVPDLATLKDKNAVTVASLPPIKTGLMTLMGSNYLEFEEDSYLAADITVTQNPRVICGVVSQAHTGGDYSAAFCIDQSGLLTAATYSKDEAPTVNVYGASSLEELPSGLKDFVTRPND